MAGNENSGRKRGSGVSRTKALKRMSQLAPGAVEAIEDTMKGVNKDRLRYEAALDVYAYNFGKPRQATDVKLEGGEELSAGLVTKLFDMIQARRRLGEGNAVIEVQNEGEEETG